MVGICAPCGERVKNSHKGVNCEGKCQRRFHFKCTKLSEDQYKDLRNNEEAKWYCHREDCVEPPAHNLKSIEATIKAAMEPVMTEFKKIQDSQDFVSKQYDALLLRLDEIDCKKNTIIQLQQEVTKLNNELEDAKAYLRRNNLVFSCVPMRQNEDPYQVIHDIANVLGLLHR